MTTINRQLRVFLCHSSDDKPAVRDLYDKLTARGIDAWLDEKKLLPGQQWKTEIPKAVREADAVIICLSKTSITKEGYVQKEIKFALDVAMEKSDSSIYLIPAKLEECQVPDVLADWHWVNLFDAQGLSLLFKSLESRAVSLGVKIEHSKSEHFIEKKPNVKIDRIPQSKIPTKDWIEQNKLVFFNSMEFMRIPSGKFIMGSNDGNENEKPQYVVNIPYDYWLARYPVTNQQYSIYAKANGIKHPVSDWEKKKTHPVTGVDWHDAMKYCKWLNNLLKTELRSGEIVRLPTEPEWEKAARGTDGRKYPWGDIFEHDKCNANSDIISGIISLFAGGTTPVNKYSNKSSTPYGCIDMVGNVWEWTYSERKAYPYNDKDGREDKRNSVTRALRGGSYYSDQNIACCTFRLSLYSSFKDNYIGFRVAICISSSISP